MSTKLFQITETDLAVLEAEIPAILDASMMTCNDTITRKRWQLVKEIISNVRWNYGPPSQVEQIPANPDDPTP